MKAAIVSTAGEQPVYGDFPEPQADEQHVVVSVKAAAVSQLAKARASGKHYSATTHYPFITGIDGTGTLSNGDPVYFLAFNAPWGSMAERTQVPAAAIVPLPASLDPVLAAAIANPGMSSWAALTRRAQLQPGETVLINGATGTSGGLAVRIARHLGAGKIIATGRNREVLDQLRAQGADITLTLDELPGALPALMKEGIDIVLDYLWGQSALDIMQAAVAGGEKAVRFVQIGSLSGQEITLHSKLLRSSGLTLMGSGLGSVSDAELIACISEMLNAAAESDFSVAFQMRPLSEVAQAWQEDDSRSRTVFTL
ncbi:MULTISPECIES: zinc-binding alcohol dehydrogenase family protein [Erwiniaceae]|uniref:Alcohol dehydrogenase n=1 Tax=Pantoea rwandensis TaxID=1076550 RepID=A0ABM5REU5_9GAMM|nr:MULTISPECIES: zinc-binding alcohol dehydrogenase family protein [Erwiniaceae]AIR84403.1 alcohol dehydrogenase [Pantoea rwandensis]MBK0094173.1 zinc-binding alcohol dehydrogenase family protein [Erwinia sp. S59]HAU5566039.1 zinc-binding alcohol dehydrogenase family protein [Serratia fonticola]